MVCDSGRRTVLGLDIGGTKTACVEGTLDGRILERIEMPTRAAEPFAETFPADRREVLKN